MEGLKATFAQCKKENRSALVTYFTCGYPTVNETSDIMLGMQAGGAGMPRRSPLCTMHCTDARALKI